MNLNTKLFILIIFCSFSSAAQKNSINYLNQKPPGMVAQIFAPGILSTEALEHSAPAFSPDGKTVVWTIMKMPSYQMRLLEMNFSNNKWSPAHVPSFSDTTINEVDPNFSADGNTLYFSTDRKVHSSWQGTNTLWYVNKTKDGWSKAKPLDTNLYKKDIYASSIANNGNRYYTVGPQGSPDWNIFTTDNSGKSSPLPPHINTKGYEDGPFIAPDESFLIFESDRPIDKESFIDLYISFRKKDGSWAEPVNMGPKINTQFAERFARVSPDGKYLFFGRNTGNGFDIYWIDSGIIDELKKQVVNGGLLK